MPARVLTEMMADCLRSEAQCLRPKADRGSLKCNVKRSYFQNIPKPALINLCSKSLVDVVAVGLMQLGSAMGQDHASKTFQHPFQSISAASVW